MTNRIQDRLLSLVKLSAYCALAFLGFQIFKACTVLAGGC